MTPFCFIKKPSGHWYVLPCREFLISALVAGWAIGLLVWLGEIPGDTGPPYDA
jgi:hypothetical protein